MNLSVLFNIPNIVGYIRILLLLLGINKSNTIFLIFYSISAILDFFDGFLARLFKQTSLLGICLDMFTDRIATVVISLRISKEKSEFFTFITWYVIIDLLSHLIHFYLSSLSSHYHKSNNNNFLLRIYYSTPFLFFICFFSECFFIHSLSNLKQDWIFTFLYYCTILKMCFHGVQLVEALGNISDRKNKLN